MPWMQHCFALVDTKQTPPQHRSLYRGRKKESLESGGGGSMSRVQDRLLGVQSPPFNGDLLFLPDTDPNGNGI